MLRRLTVIPLLPALAAAGITLTTTAVWESEDLIDGHYPYSTGCDWADVDGDGLIDLVVSNGNDMRLEYCAVYFNTPQGLDASPAWFGEPLEYHGHLECCDFDADGDVDLGVTLLGGGYPDWTYGHDAVYLNRNGALETSPSWLGEPAHNSFGITWGDFDGDGDADLAVAGGVDYVHREEPLRIYENVAGKLNPVPAWESEKHTTWTDILFGDFDNDGYLDLAAAAEHDSNAIFFGTGDGLPATPGWEDSPEWDTIKIAAGDSNRDGWLDLVLANNNQIGEGQVDVIHLSDGGPFDAEPDWVSTHAEMSSYAALADLDADGDLDLALSGWWSLIRIYENHDGRFNPYPEWLSDLGYEPVSEALLFGDYDDDGLTSRTDYLRGDGRAMAFRLSVMPVRSVGEVRVNGVALPRNGWCYGRQEGWISLGAPPADGSVIQVSYTYSTDLDLAQTDWLRTRPNVIFRNDAEMKLLAFDALIRSDGVLLSWRLSTAAEGITLYRQEFSPSPALSGHLGRHAAAYRVALATGRVSDGEPGPWEPLPPEPIPGLEGRYLDRNPPDGRVRYLLEAYFRFGMPVRFDPIEIYTGDGGVTTNGSSSLTSPWPSPADDRISFNLEIRETDAGGPVTVHIYDLAGRRVTVAYEGELTAGSHRLTADTSGLAQGVYILHLETATASASRRFVIVR